MSLYFLAVPIPKKIRARLASFCYGLPQVQWTEEENLYLILHQLGPLSESNAMEIKERLKNLFFSPFSVVLDGISFQFKRNRGSIFVKSEENPKIISLKKEINRLLKGIILPSEEGFQPYITLGFSERISPQKLGDYLSMCSQYRSEPTEIASCLFLRIKSTPKRILYETIEEYLATLPTTGED